MLSGGVAAALIAPTIGIWSKDLWLPYEYLGAFGVVTLLGILTIAAFCYFPSETTTSKETTTQNDVGDQEASPARNLSNIIRQPTFLLAIMNIAVGHSVMILIMVATPLAILNCGFSINDSTSVIQWHVLGMFLPAFFSGKLIDRWGIRPMTTLGCCLLIISGIISIAGIQLANF